MKPRVLIVDDERSIRVTLQELLVEAGYEAAMAANANEALSLLSEARFDVVVADVILPRVTGIELLQAVRAGHPAAQVILMAGQPSAAEAELAVNEGASKYLAKPVTAPDLLAAIEAVAGGEG